MRSLCLLLGIAALALGMSAVAAPAAEAWDPALCNDILRNDVERIEEKGESIAELTAFIDELQAKGENDRASVHIKNRESIRVDGILALFDYVDNDLIPNCDRGQLDPEMLARLEAARPLGDPIEETAAHTQEFPDVQIGEITSSFVPYEMLPGGGCRGPFLDFAVKVVNNGGDYPRPVDLETRLKSPAVLDTLPYFTIVIDLDYGASGKHHEVIPVTYGMLEGGKLPKAGSVVFTARVLLQNNQTHADLKARIDGHNLLALAGPGYTSREFSAPFDIPMWDIYTENTATVSGRFILDNSIHVTTKATISNKGASPTPGPVAGNFTVLRSYIGPVIGILSGKTAGPLAGTDTLIASVNVPRPIDTKTGLVVRSSVSLLCPDGSGGTLADGNVENNMRLLTQDGRPPGP